MENVVPAFGSVVRPHTTSETPACMSRLGIISVSAEAADAPNESMSATAHPSPIPRFRSDKLLISVSIGSACGVCKRRLAHALQELSQMIDPDFVEVTDYLPT
jgi:N-glycosylase/DNA lyase